MSEMNNQGQAVNYYLNNDVVNGKSEKTTTYSLLPNYFQ